MKTKEQSLCLSSKELNKSCLTSLNGLSIKISLPRSSSVILIVRGYPAIRVGIFSIVVNDDDVVVGVAAKVRLRTFNVLS